PHREPVPRGRLGALGAGLPLHGDRGAIRTARGLARARLPRHRRRTAKRPAFVVALLGIDGSGKSTISRLLAEYYSNQEITCLIGDELLLFSGGAPRRVQPLLKEKVRRWLSAQARDARSLARYKIPKISELLLRDALLGEARRWYGPDIVFMDGSPLLNMTAWSALYRDELMSQDFCARAMEILSGGGQPNDPLYGEFPELKAMKRLGLTRLHRPDAVIFLDVAPATSMKRILGRGEKMQVHENEEKLGRLREAYKLVVRALNDKPDLSAFVLDGEREQTAIRDEARSLIDRVRVDTGEEAT
ncbi:deoxynucleoside kinase, partial [bacterium]|nr:deoxynucleoside kinase [bacterium]